jgi:dTDP-4-dehydrorhamnose reductase
METILVTGSNGQLGSELKELASQYGQFEFTFTDVAELDLTDEAAIEAAFSELKPAFVINCAAYTAVDKAETDLDLARLINATAPEYLAKASKKHGCKLIQVSTDYVFDGTAHMPYTEEIPTSPNSAYGVTKLDGEEAVEKNCDDFMIIRTSWLYSSFGNNFVKTMIRLGT